MGIVPPRVLEAGLKVLVVLNHKGGTLSRHKPQEGLALVKAAFDTQGVDATIVAVRGKDISGAIRRGLDSRPGFDAVVVGGGDGSVNAAASVLADTDIPLGVLPLGTFNHFAKDLSIPLALDEAARVVAEGRTTNVDLGEVNGRIFVNNSSLGIYPHLVATRERVQRRGVAKWAAAGAAAAVMLWRLPRHRVRVRAEGWEAERQTPCLFVGNNPYDLDVFGKAKRSRLDSGELYLCLVARPSRIALFMLVVRALFGRIEAEQDLIQARLTEVTITPRRRIIHVALDGESLLLDTPLRYRIRPRALRVLVPTKMAP